MYVFLYFWILRMPFHKIYRDSIAFVPVLSTHFSNNIRSRNLYFRYTHALLCVNLKLMIFSEFLRQNQLYIFLKAHETQRGRGITRIPYSLIAQAGKSGFSTKSTHFFITFICNQDFQNALKTQWGPRIRKISLKMYSTQVRAKERTNSLVAQAGKFGL